MTGTRPACSSPAAMPTALPSCHTKRSARTPVPVSCSSHSSRQSMQCRAKAHHANDQRGANMNRLQRTTLVVAFFAAFFPLPSEAQHAGHHQSVSAAQLKWAPVPSLPKGAQISVIEGPMNQAVPFTVRLKFPDNYRIPPHTHPAVERITVLSGTFHMGMGEKFERS